MTPAEHYAEAERLLGEVVALESLGSAELDAAMVSALQQRALTHATLATVEDRTFRRTTPLGELTEKELRVLRDAVASEKRSRPAGSLRSVLLESVGSKLGLWDKTVHVTTTEIDQEDQR